MPAVQTELPKELRPYTFHGVYFKYEEGVDWAEGECPFCGKPRKFRVEVKTGIFKCFVCGTGNERGTGNATVFVRAVWDRASQDPALYRQLAEGRGLLRVETLRQWGVRFAADGCPLLPGYNADGALVQLYKYVKDRTSGKGILYPTPTLGHGFHRGAWDAKRQEVWVVEGPWDGMALQEAMASARRDPDGLAFTTAGSTLARQVNVMAVPGCGSVGEPFKRWTPLLGGKRVSLLFDSDHPREHNGKTVEPSGFAALKRAVGLLGLVDEKPREVRYLRWGDEGYDPNVPSGYDLRDALRDGNDAAERVRILGTLLERVHPVPEAFVPGQRLPGAGEPTAEGDVEIHCRPCDSWRKLVNSCRKAMRWTDGLDVTFSAMLASITSTKLLGSPVWLQVISPPSCLDEDTPIHDPVDGTTETVKARWEASKPFNVYTKTESGEVVIGEAQTPHRYEPTEMYEVAFRSGRTMRVTAGHRFWTGQDGGYLPLLSLLQRRSVSCRLPSISESDLSTQTPDARRYSRTAEGSRCRCSEGCRRCDGRPLLAGDTGRSFPPSSADARRRTRDGSCEDGSATVCTCTDRPTSLLLSKRGDDLHECSPRLVSSDGYPDPGNTSEASLAGLAVRCGRTQLRETRLDSRGRIRLLVGSLPPATEGIDNESLSFSGGVAPKTRRTQSDEHTRRSSFLADRNTERRSVFSERRASEPDDESELPPPGGQLDSHPVPGSCGSLSRCGERHTTRHSDASAHRSTSSESLVRGKVDVSTLTTWDEIVNIKFVGVKHYYDFHVPVTNNYWACGYFHHNTGKTVLCEALSVNRKFVKAVSTLRGFHSGYQTDADGAEDHSLVSKIYDMTLITKDGDTLLKSPNLDQILSEARDVYDGASRTSFRNKRSKDYTGIRMTWLLCGTSSLRTMDSSELGERFLKCVIMDGIDEDLEDDIVWRVVNRAHRNMSFEADGTFESQHDEDAVDMMQLAGGYVGYLRTNARDLASQVTFSEERLKECGKLGRFVSYMRARPSKTQDEVADREMPARLAEQLTRLAHCLAVVLNRTEVDDEVMRRVRKIAVDTAAGVTLDLARSLIRKDRKVDPTGREGKDVKYLVATTPSISTEGKCRDLLRFLRKIGATDLREVEATSQSGLGHRPRWVLTDRVRRLVEEVYAS